MQYHGKKSMAKVKLNKHFYPKQAVKQAIKAYSQFASMKLEEQGEYYCVDIHETNVKHKNLIKEEFANYALALSKHGC